MSTNFWKQFGIPSQLIWGYVGLLLFMVGDGTESGLLSPYLIRHDMSQTSVAWLFTVYGLVAAIAGWLSAALSDIWGPRRVIIAGVASWLIFEVLFLTVGLGHMDIPAIFITYGLRGFGYPFFAFGFLVWITVIVPSERLGSAMGWFWFAFTGGLPTLGSFVASISVPWIGTYGTLWFSLIMVAAGGLVLFLGVRDSRGSYRLVPEGQKPIRILLNSIAIGWKKPKTGIAFLVRLINTAPEFGFLVFLPTFFTSEIGFTLPEWLRLLGAIFLSNIVWNLLFGFLGDRIGWTRTVAFFGGFGCMATTLALYYVPSFDHSFSLSVVVGMLYGATLAGYVPLSALMPSLAPEQKGAALSLLNLGAGASVWVGPAIVGLLLRPIGIAGVMWVFAGLYLVSGIMALFLKLDSMPQPRVLLPQGVLDGVDCR